MTALKFIIMLIVAVPIVLIGITGLGVAGGMAWFFTVSETGQTAKLIAEVTAPEQAELIYLQIYLWGGLGILLIGILLVIMYGVVMRQTQQSDLSKMSWDDRI